MHIPDAYLSPATEAVAYGLMIPFWVTAARRTMRELTTRQTPLLSIGAAFCFAVQMFNIPAIGGTTAHALGATLLAILVGPWAALLGMTLTLAIQALLFGDGGVLSLGANSFNMALVATFTGYGVFRLACGNEDHGSPRSLIASGLGAFCGTVLAAFSAAIFLGIQPIIAHDSAGHALYCPFGLQISIPAMVITHLLVAAPAEAIITVAALSYIWRSFPEFVTPQHHPKTGNSLRLIRTLAVVLVLTPIGIIASGSGWGEWDAEQIKAMIGYTPAGIAQPHELIKPLLPDYGFGGVTGKPWEIIGYLVSAIVGCAAVAIFTRSLIRRPKMEAMRAVSTASAKATLPDWMMSNNPAARSAKTVKAPWLETTVLRMRTVIARAIVSESTARRPGLLQSIHPTAKAIGFLCALVATGLATSAIQLSIILVTGFALAVASHVSLREFGLRTLASVMFFGLVFAIPITLESVTHGSIAFRLVGIAFSEPGLKMASLILLRLSAGISLAMLWNQTTRWNELLSSLGGIGIPRPALTVAALTYRYLFVMVETLGEMVEARTSRQVGTLDKRQARSYAGTGTAVLFAKSLVLTEETHLAMISRGFENHPKPIHSSPWRFADRMLAFGGVFALLCVLLQGFNHAF